MPDSSTKKKKRKPKRTENSEEIPAKILRTDGSYRGKKQLGIADSEGEISKSFLLEEEKPKLAQCGSQWRNLRLVHSLQRRDLDLERRVEMAFDYVNERLKGGGGGGGGGGDAENGDCDAVSVSRLVVFLSDWVQSLLISKDEKRTVGNERRVIEACLDPRCWAIFKFCLEESVRFHVSLRFSKDLLGSIGFVVRNVLMSLKDGNLGLNRSFHAGEGFALYGLVVDCVSLVFSSCASLPNENLDLWISTVRPVLDIVCAVCEKKLEVERVNIFAVQFACVVLEPFTNFLRVHPARKDGFNKFVDKLLEPLLYLLGVFCHCVDTIGNDGRGRLFFMVKEVMSQGLFHTIHLDGFLSLRGSEKYSISSDGKVDESIIVTSYHRHFFFKLKEIVGANKESVLSGLGELFHLFVDRVRTQKASSFSEDDTILGGKERVSARIFKRVDTVGSAPLNNGYGLDNLSAEKRKSIFDFYVLIMEPLVTKMNGYLETRMETGSNLLDAHNIIKSTNNLFAVLLREKLYVKTEDISQEAWLIFLKKVYNVIWSIAAYLLSLSTYKFDSQEKEIFTSLVSEIFVSIGYLLDIEYEVFQNELSDLWIMILSFMAIGFSFNDLLVHSPLNTHIIKLGCQLWKLYSELRQVKNAIFMLCKAIRLTVHRSEDDGASKLGSLWSRISSLPYQSYAKSVTALLCAADFKLALYSAIKSVPEGQASECIRNLCIDFSESLDWVKNSTLADDEDNLQTDARNSSMSYFDLQAELFGRGLCELYTLTLDSLTVTSGNSILIGGSVKSLITAVCPCMGALVGEQQQSINNFFFSITGRTCEKMFSGDKQETLKFKTATQWILVFFLRLFMSCRSLYRQVISLMPPDNSRKMSAVIGDMLTVYSGMDWMNTTEWKNDDYFSWIFQHSSSLLAIIESISDMYSDANMVCCGPLVYVLHAMALHRLVDINRMMHSLDYIQQSNDHLTQMKLLDETDLSFYSKKSKKLRKRISVLKQEAAGLTKFLMSHLPKLETELLSVLYVEDAACMDIHDQVPQGSGSWILGACPVNEKLVQLAIWWLLCKNIDIWSVHASQKKLKLFLSHLICSSLPSLRVSLPKLGKQHNGEAALPNEISLDRISFGLLTDSILYEQKFVRRHLASRYCHLLEKSVLALFTTDMDFSLLPNWQEVLSLLGNSSIVVSYHESVTRKCHLESNSQISGESTGRTFTACQSLLDLLSWMPKGYLNSKSFSLYATHLLNLERLVIGRLLECQNAFYSDEQCKFLRLLVSCRRALKRLVVAYCEDKMRTSRFSPIPIPFEDTFCVLWLVKSALVVVGLQDSEDNALGIRDMIFSLMDHTSYVFLSVSKHLAACSVDSIINGEPQNEQSRSNVVQKGCNSGKRDPHLNSSNVIEGWKDVLLVAENLKEHTHSSLFSLKQILDKEKVGDFLDAVNCKRLSCLVSCFSGFLWGLASAFSDANATNGEHNLKLLKRRCEPLSRIYLCVDDFADFVNFALEAIFSKNTNHMKNLFHTRRSQTSDFISISFETQHSYSQHHQKGTLLTCPLSSDTVDCSMNGSPQRRSLEDAGSVTSILNKIRSYDCKSVNGKLLQTMLKGDYPEAATLMRQLFIASSAILRLNLLMRCSPRFSSTVPILIEISEVLLLGLADLSEEPHPFSFIWLDGVLKFMEEVGNHFPSTDPTLSKDVYTKLIELQLKGLAKCISLQGKDAALASHEIESSTKIVYGYTRTNETRVIPKRNQLDEFIARLRMSLKVLITKPSDLLLLSAMEAIGKAMVGSREGCSVFEIDFANRNGGKVSPTVAAGVSCLDIVLENISGRKRVAVVKLHMQSLMAALFNIILHLRGPSIFYDLSCGNLPDPGAVTLMCIEVLTKVSGKHTLFQMESRHIAQCLRIPAAIFQDFGQFGLAEDPVSMEFFLSAEKQESDPLMGMKSQVVHREFSIELFAACCRLSYTILKHHKSESERCIAVLQESVRVLLRCLEAVETHNARKGYFSWNAREGVKCASYFRRIYEELRQQKDVFGQHSFKFLADYIHIYSGCGFLGTGIRREVDEALKPGVYALIDATSRDDLQHLHSAFGEGPCRNTLASLQHDYKLNFQYEGKV